MNNLSLMLYFADVAEKVGIVSLLLSIAFFIGAVVGLIGVVGTRIENSKEYWAPAWIGVVPTLAFFFFVTLAVLIPSKNTIYLIAGSEIGERVVKTPEAQQMFSDIREVIQSQLKELKKD